MLHAHRATSRFSLTPNVEIVVADPLQCPGNLPCANCVRRGLLCSRNKTDTTIKLADCQQSVVNTFRCTRLPSTTDRDLYISEFFTSFLGQNEFGGRPRSLTFSLQHGLAQNESLISSVSAIGALQRSRHQAQTKASYLRDALAWYNSAIYALRAELQSIDGPGLQQLLWPTFLLGLFEVRYLPQTFCSAR